MSVETTTTSVMYCDAKACRATLEVPGDDEEAWKAALQKGWSFEDHGRDVCPWHTDPERRIT